MTNAAAARFLTWVSVPLVAIGVLMAVMAAPALNGYEFALLEMIFGPSDGAAELNRFGRLFSAIVGGLTAGFGMCFIFLVAPLIARGDPLGRRGAIIVILTWFVTDSVGSALSGVAFNVVLNAVLLALLLTPVLLAGKANGELSR